MTMIEICKNNVFMAPNSSFATVNGFVRLKKGPQAIKVFMASNRYSKLTPNAANKWPNLSLKILTERS